MSDNDIIGLVITSVIGLLLVIMGVFMLFGRGSFLIAGFNTMSEEEKNKYDRTALCKLVGKIILSIGLATPLVSVGGIFNITWIMIGYPIFVFGISIFALIYINTGNRFKK